MRVNGRNWKTGGVNQATITTYLIDSLRTNDHDESEGLAILSACGIDDPVNARPILREIISSGDCTMRYLLNRARQGEARGIWGTIDEATAFNILRLCVVDTCCQQVLVSSLL